MRAVEITSYGDPRVLRLVERSDPVPGPDEILIAVAAAGVARADALQRQGKYPPPVGVTDIPGLDVSGTVVAVGKDVTTWSIGDRVCAILSGGGYAELCLAPCGQALPIPENWTFAEAATLPENLFTTFDNLVTRAELQAGETVLVHGGTSGIGTMAIMLAKALESDVLATAGTPTKCEACCQLGARVAINYNAQDFVQKVLEQTAGRGVDVILDIVGGSYLARNLEALATEGRIAVVSTLGGSMAEIDLLALMRKRARILGSTMRARTVVEKSAVARALRSKIWPILPRKQFIRPVINAAFPLSEASEAHALMESGKHIGKIVLLSDQDKKIPGS